MKKPLRNVRQTFRSMMDGNVRAWDSGMTDDLIGMVNHVVSEELGASAAYVNPGFVFGTALHHWMERLLQGGVSAAMIEDLNADLEDLRFQHVLRLSKSGKTSWQFIADFQSGLDPDASAAYCFSHLLETGALDGLKRCELTDCDNFFIGRPNAKWCSMTCGSRHRVRTKRKRDR